MPVSSYDHCIAAQEMASPPDGGALHHRTEESTTRDRNTGGHNFSETETGHKTANDPGEIRGTHATSLLGPELAPLDVETHLEDGLAYKAALCNSNSCCGAHPGTCSCSQDNSIEEKSPSSTIPVTDMDQGIIGWENQDDPEMPLNFEPRRKWLMISLLSTITFMTPLASSILAPALTSLAKEFDETSITRAALPISIFLLGYAVGPLFLSPLSEIYGRNIVLIISSAWFCAWLIGCALAPTLDTLILFRFLAGVGGSACQTIGGAIVADMFPIQDRGRAMALWSLGPMFGPSCAPVIGGFVSETIGWRWVSWIAFIPATMTVLAMVICNRETNHQVLIARKTRRLRAQLNRPDLRSCYIDPTVPATSKGEILLNGFRRPLKMLFRSAIIFSVSLYIAFAYGCLYLLFNTIPIVFQGSYHWSLGITGLAYLGLLIGYMIGLASFTILSDKTVVRMTAANGGISEPEMRLPFCIWFALVLPVTFFWYGWSADKAVHWIVPVIGIVPFGIGIVGVWLPIQAYIVDIYPQFAASGLAAFSVLRCTVAAFLPLAGPQMYAKLGVGWGSSLLGGELDFDVVVVKLDLRISPLQTEENLKKCHGDVRAGAIPCNNDRGRWYCFMWRTSGWREKREICLEHIKQRGRERILWRQSLTNHQDLATGSAS
ncbi:fluconazole resistance protein [Purpureocillium lavendulum]|uniref:Fluconazole resistance protein n=1 Tax=Purpureocillium lavendulum TaxID=1247861 RepID=A0AB34FIP2_9HYPO|nr:fluconazole resistance protein [Purpureocillium lavendulum]